MLRNIFNICLISLLSVAVLFAQSTSWKGTTSTSWTTSANWTNGVPTSTSDVVIGDANFTGGSDPTLSSTVTVNSLTLGSTNSPFLTLNNKGTLTVNGNVSIAAGATIDQNRRAFTVKGNWTNNGTYSTSSNNAPIVFAGTSQTISGTPVSQLFRKITINAGTTVTLASNITINSTFTVNGTLDPALFKVTNSGTAQFNNGSYLYIKASVLNGGSGNFSANPTFSAGSTVEFAGSTAQTVTTSAITLSNVIISNSTTVTLGANITINSGDVQVDAGTLDLSTFTLSRSAAGGLFTLSDGTALRCANTTSPFPVNFTTVSLSALSTVEYYASGSQSISTQSYGNLSLSGSGTKSTTGAISVIGNLNTSGTVTLQAGAAITVTGVDSIGSGTTFNASTFSHTFNNSLVNSGTLTGNTSTITLSGNNSSLTGNGTYNFNTLTISGSGITAGASTNISAAGNFSTAGSGTFTHTSGGTGTFTMSSATGSISGSGIIFSKFTIASGSAISTSASFAVSSDMTVTGSFTAASGTVTLSGSSKTIGGSGSLTFSSLNVSGSITTTRNFSVSSNVSVTGSLTATAGTVTFSGTSTLGGTANLFNVTLNGSSLQLGSGSILGISGALALTAGTFNVTSTTPNSVSYNSSGAQTITAATYHNLTLSGSGSKSAGGAITINGDLTINSGVTFSAGAFSHSLTGNFVNSGTFTAGSSTITFNGTGDASITGVTTFNSLTLNKSSSLNILALQNNITVASLTMTSGRMLTGSNILTVTSSRTGNGTVIGTITRTHSFSNSTAYAFEGPFNTLTFASGAGSISSITVTSSLSSVADFTFGSSVNREYTIAVTGGPYTSTLRLHYDDGELNGNTEAALELWHNTSSWTTFGKSNNSATDNWVELDTLTSLNGRWSLSEFVKVVRWKGSVSSAWETAGNWLVIQGSPTLPPGNTDVVQIGDSAFTNQPSINSSVSVRSINFGSAQSATLSISSGSLTTNGNIEGSWSANRTHSIAVGSNTMTVGGSLMLGDGTSNHILNVSVGSGTIGVNGIIQQTSNSTITVGSGTITIGGDFIRASGTFTAGTGNVTMNGSSAQSLAGGINYYNLTINKSAGSVTLGTSANVTNNLFLTAGTLVTNANIGISGNISIASGATLNGSTATITLGGNWSNGGTFVSGTGTLNLNGGGTQTLSASTFNNLVINKGLGTATPTGNISVNGNLTVSAGEFDLTTFTSNRSVLGGTLTLSSGATLTIGGSNNFPANFAVNSISSSANVLYNGASTQTISPQIYGNLTLSNGTTNAKSLSGSTTVAGTLVISSGATLNASSAALTVQGNFNNSGTFTASTSTVQLTGTSKSLSGATTFNNLSISGSYTATGNISVGGSLSNSGTFSTGSTTLTLSGNVTNSGTITNSGTVTFPGTGTQSISLNSGFTSSGTVNFNGSVAPALADASAPSFQNVTINNSAGIAPSLGYTIGGTFTVAGGGIFSGGNFSHTFNGTFTNSGSVTSSGTLLFSPASSTTITLPGTSFSSTGIVQFGGTGAITLSSGSPTINNLVISNSNGSGITLVSNWTVNGDLTIQSGSILNAGTGLSHTFAGNFTSNGTFNGSTSTITFNNATNKNISASGTAAFYHVVISASDSITVVSNISIQGNLTNNGTMVTDGVIISFTGSSNGTISTSGSAFPIDQLTVAKSLASVTLGVNVSNLSDLTISSGTLDQSTFSIAENSTDGGSITIASGATLKIGGTNGLTAFANGYTISSSGTVEFAGSSQSIQTTPTYGNLTISTAGTKTASGTLTIAGHFSLASGTFAAGSNTHNLAGNWTMSSGATSGSNTINFNGSGSQTITSTGAFNNLTVNKSSGNISLSSNITINGTLTFTNGNIVTGTNTLSIGSSGTISRTSGHVVGNLLKNVATGATSITYQIGDATTYAPLSLSFASVTTAGNLTASTTQSDHSAIVNSGINPSKSVNRFWTLANSGVIFTTYSATFTFVNGDIDAGSTTANFNVSKLTSGTWTIQTIGTRTGTTTQASGISAFGDFVIGESGKIWNGSSSNNWNDAANWTPSGIPTSLDAITVGTAATININTAAVSSDVTIGHSSVTVTIVSGNSLTVSGNLVISSGTLNTESSFPTISGTTTLSGGTIGYTGTVAQTVKALDYSNLTISGSHSSNNVTMESGTIRISGTFTPSASFTTGNYVTTGNSIEFNGLTAQTIPAFNYQNLTVSGSRANDTVTFSSSGTIGVAGTFSLTATSAVYKNTGSTIHFNGNGSQTIPALSYNNLSISGTRGSNTITFAADSMHIAGSFAPTADAVTYSQSGTIFDFNGSSPQTIPAFTYNSLVFSNSGTKSISSSIISNNNFVNRTASSITIDAGNTVQIIGLLNNAGTIVNNGTVKAGN